MHTNPTADQSWHTPNHESLWIEQRCNQGPNVTVGPIRQTAFELAHFQQIQNL